jgi:hypothetical protein
MILTSENFLQFAMNCYENPQCFNIKEFENDLNRFDYLKKLLNRYKIVGELRERLILNHIIVIYNVFGDSATNMLLFKLQEHKSSLITFMMYLNRISEDDVHVVDQTIIDVLRKL